MSFQPRKKSYILVNADGDVLTIDEAGLEEFIRLNDVGYEGRYCEPSWADELRALQVGQVYHGEGGASPEWSVERGQGSPAHQGGLRSGEVPAASRGKATMPRESKKQSADTKIDWALVQDAYHYALAAADSDESVFRGRNAEYSKSKYLRLAIQNSKKAGLNLSDFHSAPLTPHLANARNIVSAIRQCAAKYGIDANSGEPFKQW